MSFKNFSDFKLIAALQRALGELGYKQPTPIQTQAIPLLLQGKDILGIAATGTGKTAAFALPILNHVITKPRALRQGEVRTLVLAPTRELAQQIHKSFLTYGKHVGLKTALVYGGISQQQQVKSLANGVDVMVATPGRLRDLVKQRRVLLGTIEIFVLDEADRMLDMGFVDEIRKIAALMPKKRQTLLFSATMPKPIESLAAFLLNNPARVQVGRATAAKAELKIEQSVMYVQGPAKRSLLLRLLRDKSLKMRKVVVFTRTKHSASRLAATLTDSGIRSEAIHGDKVQAARQQSLENFRAGRVGVLVATDVIARGIDIDDITHVINFDLPAEAENYVHRIGRTGRAGASGTAISFADPQQDRAKLREIETLVGRSIRSVNRRRLFIQAARCRRWRGIRRPVRFW